MRLLRGILETPLVVGDVAWTSPSELMRVLRELARVADLCNAARYRWGSGQWTLALNGPKAIARGNWCPNSWKQGKQ
ncbi:hypothetical protein GCM10010307_73480 [Streptomyces vastus]|uniref:Uncharacterized protein n=1 Tax=Streptomyces vastus TaxID=285451 RepID=A0ABN3RQ64_9ACTN